MARYRRGHHARKGSGLRIVILVAILIVVGILLLISRKAQRNTGYTWRTYSGPDISADFLPGISKGEIVHHRYYSLSYREEFEQAEWVAYTLTVEQLNAPRVPRTDYFNPDYSVRTRSAFYRDYSGSGYTRGHLAPAADMAFDTLAMRESFYMSNICPQTREFNNGVWRELEEQTRDWARANGIIYIATGPVLTSDISTRIGKNRVAVPACFYKILVARDGPGLQSIAFVIPNALSEQHLSEYTVTIDSVEALTGIDFFPKFVDALREDTVELQRWSFDERRFTRRVNEWNHQ